MYNARIVAFDKYVPEEIVTNVDLSKIVDTSDEWISTRTGVSQRRVSKDENTSELCIKAGKNILEKTGTNPEDIDIIIVATITPDYATPSTACLVQAGLKAKNAFCFDLSAACSGFVYALSVADKFIKCGTYKKALVFGAETLSKITDWEDRRTCVLFGDGAGCALVERSDKNGFICEDIHSNGELGLSLTAGQQQPNSFLKHPEVADKKYLEMDGRAIFSFSTRQVPVSVRAVVDNSGIDWEEIKYVVPHQANSRIVDVMAKKLGLPIEKFYMNMSDFGNTSAGSIPIALAEMSEKGLIGEGDKIILTGFGGGLTWGSLLIEL